MNNPHTQIIRIAARGDGVTADGRHVAMGVPGDQLTADGELIAGPNRRDPTCQHFGSCGGCQLQHVSNAAYTDYVRDRVVGALTAQHLEGVEVFPAQIVAAGTRRRAALRAIKGPQIGKGKGAASIQIGFSAAQSNQIVPMRECPVLLPSLFATIAPLQTLLADLLPPKAIAQIKMTAVDQGIDLLIEGIDPQNLTQLEALADFASATQLARLCVDRGDGPETLWEPQPVTISFSGRSDVDATFSVPFPAYAFLQASAHGEEYLRSAVQRIIGNAAMVADLFCGLGTFAAALAGEGGRAPKIYAADAQRDAIVSLKAGVNRSGRSIFPDHRDLYRKPLNAAELNRFEAVILDPPRAGAEEQIAELAKSAVPAIAYVSCNPASFARDAKILAAGDYSLINVQPVGQFSWSTHVELVGEFRR
jgi:23S rRNA (uracil1939-C5)-methyltransferase